MSFNVFMVGLKNYGFTSDYQFEDKLKVFKTSNSESMEEHFGKYKCAKNCIVRAVIIF